MFSHGPSWSAMPPLPREQLYGPPLAPDSGLVPPDFGSFTACYLLTESLATVLGYIIVMDLVKDHHVCLFSPAGRLLFALAYIVAKMFLIDSAFHGSVYVIVSSISGFCIGVSALLAGIFHYGPLIWAFPDSNRRRRQASSSSTLQSLVDTLKFFFVHQHFCMKTSELVHRKLDDDTLLTKSCPIVTRNGVARVPGLFNTDMEVRVDEWNQWITKYWTDTLIAAGQVKMQTLASDDDVAESRFLFIMQTDGLILDFLLKEPTARLVYRVSTPGVMPFELVLRFMLRYHGGQRRPVFLYAECLHIFGTKSTSEQKTAIGSMLQQLNASCNHHVDVPLRSLRCRDFIQTNYRPLRRRAPSNSNSNGNGNNSKFRDLFTIS